MADAMTLEEAVAAVRAGPTVQEACLTMSSEARAKYERGVAVLRAHAERTLAAREGEPEWLRNLRRLDLLEYRRLLPETRRLLAITDTLTAENAALRRDFEAEVQRVLRLTHRLGTALEGETALRELLSEATAERDALRARVERMTGALRDIMAAYEYELNDGDRGADNYYLVEDIDDICRRALEARPDA